jgi:hypothetical protein
MPLLDKAAGRARKRETLRAYEGNLLKRDRGIGEKSIRTSREAAERPYKKRMECDQAKMISRRLEEELTTARGVEVSAIDRRKRRGGMHKRADLQGG